MISTAARDRINSLIKGRPGAILIAGPTASGKSFLALHLARDFAGEIINADAMQVYQDLPILTACPSAQEHAEIPHHLYGFLDGSERCSAGIWARAAALAAAEAIDRNKTPIIVGGTGFYFKALIDGLSPIPEIPPETTRAGAARYTALGAQAFLDEVISQDPAMAHLPATDRQRLIRAWAVYHETGTPLSAFQRLPRKPLLTQINNKFVLNIDRTSLYHRCDARFETMLARGALAEVERLQARFLPADLPVMKSLGFRELSAYLRGEITFEAAKAAAQQATRRFAKRQMTWFRNQMTGWSAVSTMADEPQ